MTTQTPPQTTDGPVPVDGRTVSALEAAGCTASDWSLVKLHPGTDLRLIRNTAFEGNVSVGLLDGNIYPGSGICNATLRDVEAGDGVRIRNIHGLIANAVVGECAVIENCSRITYSAGGSAFGIGSEVNVLDETGSRPVTIYPGMSAQAAMLEARSKRDNASNIRAQVLEHIEALPSSPGIGRHAVVTDCGVIRDVDIRPGAAVSGAASLINGTVIDSAAEAATKTRGNTPGNRRREESLPVVGQGVDAEDFIIEDAHVSGNVLLRHCYVGQGVRIENGFSAHDSLFFANCTMENGEAGALFAGPYTVSVHKATLLIGCQTSFMNAGSGTNQSNHMYKLGPVHWGVLERGVKTSSGSYLMLGANIGAFSLLMGQHKTHPDSTELPFSYLFGDPQGATVVVPGVMLRSCGLLRDEVKWPARDRRKALPSLNDRIVHDVLNPVTVDAMINALDIIRPMLSRHADDDRFHRYKGMKLSRASLDRATKLYHTGVMKYLARVFFPDGTAPDGWEFPKPRDSRYADTDAEPWTDLAGQPVPREVLHRAIHAGSVGEREEILDAAFRDYRTHELDWIAARFPAALRAGASEILNGAREFDSLVELDRSTYLDSLSAENAMLAL